MAAGPAMLMAAGCGTPGAPQPPSLKLPEPVADLTAVRAGASVTLRWTMPGKSTDRLRLKDPVPVSICWREQSASGAGSCQPFREATFAPEAKAETVASLPPALGNGNPRPVSLFVELKSPRGRSAGLSNPAIVLAGKAPAPVTGLSAEVRADGVALHSAADGEATPVRLHRTLLTPPRNPVRPKSTDSAEGGALKPNPESPLRDLLVDPPAAGESAGALDTTARFGQVYRYTAQRLVRVTLPRPAAGPANGPANGPVGGPADAQAGTQIRELVLELAGEDSPPVRVETVDTFPPAVPRGLVAVFDSEQRTIDLSWEPDKEEDLAGYIVYRADGSGPWQRVSGPQPLAGAAYPDTTAEAGHSYRYAVSAIDQLGHESQRSAEARETVPNP